MSNQRHQLEKAVNELEASLERLVSARGQVQPGLVNEFRFALKNLERYFALAFDGLSVREARRLRLMIKRMREATDDALVDDPARYVSLVRAGTSLLGETTDLLEVEPVASGSSTVAKQAKAEKPVASYPLSLPQTRRDRASPLILSVVLLLLGGVGFIGAYFGFANHSGVHEEPDSNHVVRNETPAPGAQPTHRMASPLGRELSRRTAFGVRGEGLEFADPLMVIEWLDLHFSAQPSSQVAYWRLLEGMQSPPEDVPGLARELATKAVLTRYASHQALLPSEVLHAQGAEGLGLAIFFAQSAMRLGLPFDGFAQTQGGPVALVGGKRFGLEDKALPIQKALTREESSRLVLNAVKTRCLLDGDPRLESLLTVTALVESPEAAQELRLQLRDRLFGQLDSLSLTQMAWLRTIVQKDSGETLSLEQCREIDRIWQSEMPTHVMERWLSRDVHALDANGLSVAERLSGVLAAANALSEQRRRQLLLWTAEATPIRVVAGFLDRYEFGQDAQDIVQHLTIPQWDFGELRMLRAACALGRGQETQAMAELELAARAYPSLATKRVLVCARQFITLAINRDAWTEAESMLDYAQRYLPRDQIIERLEAEFQIARGDVQRARIAFTAYVKRYPGDEEAAATLELLSANDG